MPPAAKRPCRKAMCPATTQDPSGYCPAHAALSSGWNRVDRGSAERRGYDSEWRRVRREVLKRDRYLCRCDECQAAKRVLPATEVDHRIPKFEGGTDAPGNLYAINSDCHKRKTQAEAQRARRR